jgi:hypothetical protein
MFPSTSCCTLEYDILNVSLNRYKDVFLVLYPKVTTKTIWYAWLVLLKEFMVEMLLIPKIYSFCHHLTYNLNHLLYVWSAKSVWRELYARLFLSFWDVYFNILFSFLFLLLIIKISYLYHILFSISFEDKFWYGPVWGCTLWVCRLHESNEDIYFFK